MSFCALILAPTSQFRTNCLSLTLCISFLFQVNVFSKNLPTFSAVVPGPGRDSRAEHKNQADEYRFRVLAKQLLKLSAALGSLGHLLSQSPKPVPSNGKDPNSVARLSIPLL